MAAREPKQTHTKSADKNQKVSNEKDLETIRQWQKHYRKAFPSFVFYFESLPDEVGLRFSRQILLLGGVSPTVELDSVGEIEANDTLPIPARREVLLQVGHTCHYDTAYPK